MLFRSQKLYPVASIPNGYGLGYAHPPNGQAGSPGAGAVYQESSHRSPVLQTGVTVRHVSLRFLLNLFP